MNKKPSTIRHRGLYNHCPFYIECSPPNNSLVSFSCFIFSQRPYYLQTYHFPAFLLYCFSFFCLSSFPLSFAHSHFVSFFPSLTLSFLLLFSLPASFLSSCQSICPIDIPTLGTQTPQGFKLLSVFFTALSQHLKQALEPGSVQ